MINFNFFKSLLKVKYAQVYLYGNFLRRSKCNMSFEFNMLFGT